MTAAGAVTTDRRRFGLGLGAAAAASALPNEARAQVGGVEVLTASAPGDGQDQLARSIAEGLGTTRLTPRAMAVNVAGDERALPNFADGKRPRAVMMVMGLSTLGALRLGKREGALDACRPLARLAGEHLPIVAPAGSKVASLPDLMDAIRADAAAVIWAGRMPGSADHQLCLELTRAAGGDPARATFRSFATSAEASHQALVGSVTVATGALAEYYNQIRGGTLKALALASPERARGVDIPTLREQGVDVASLNWRGVVTRDGVGSAMIGRYGEALRRLARTDPWRGMIDWRRWEDLYLPEDKFARFIALERTRVAAILDRARPA